MIKSMQDLWLINVGSKLPRICIMSTMFPHILGTFGISSVLQDPLSLLDIPDGGQLADDGDITVADRDATVSVNQFNVTSAAGSLQMCN